MDSFLLYLFYFGAVVIHVVSVLITAFFIFPLQIKEARVKNGLKALRRQLLLFGAWIIAVGVVSIIVLTARFYLSGDTIRWIVSSLIFFHSVGFFAFSILGYKIYHSQYTDEHKEVCTKIAKASGHKEEAN